MPPKPMKRLGRGLEALISIPSTAPEAATASAPSEAGPAIWVKIDQIRPNPYQPRREIDPVELQKLAASIQQNGLLQPIVVRQVKPDLYELIAGERRWRASQLVGTSKMPAILREATDQQMIEIALIENIYRENLNAIDRALAYRQYCDTFQINAEQVAERLGEDRSTVSNYLRLLELPTDVRQQVAGGQLSMGHARAILGLRTALEMTQLARLTVEQDWSVRQVEQAVREALEKRQAASQELPVVKPAKRPLIRNLEQQFIQTLNTKVEIRESRRKGRGKIIIHYGNLDDFDRISERLGIPHEAEL